MQTKLSYCGKIFFISSTGELLEKSSEAPYPHMQEWMLLHPRVISGLEKILASYDIDPDEYLFGVEHYLATRHLPFPWAIVFLPQEIELVGYFLIRRGMLALRCLPYAGITYAADSLSPMLGAMLIYSKADLERLADRKPLFSSIWNTLKNRAESECWVSFPPLPAKTWLRLHTCVDRHLYARLKDLVRW